MSSWSRQAQSSCRACPFPLGLLALLIGRSLALASEAAPAAPQLFTVEEAVVYARKHNLTLQAQREQAESKARAVGQALSLRRLSLLLSFQSSRSTQTARFGGRNVAEEIQHQGQMSLGYPLFQFGKDAIQIGVAKAQERLESLEAKRLEAELALEVKEAFYNVYLTGMLCDLATKEVETLQEVRRTVGKKLESGLVPALELTRAEVDLKGQEGERQVACHNAGKARTTLKQRMGFPLDKEIAVKVEGALPFLPAIDKRACVRQALARRPEVEKLRLEKQVTEGGMRVAKKGNLPDVHFFTNLSWQQGNAFAPQSALELGVRLQARLHDGGALRSAVGEHEELLQSLQQRIKDLQEKVALEVGLRILDLEEAFARYELSLKQVALAEELMRTQRSRFENGYGIPLELLDAQNRLQEANVGLQQATADYYLALASLEKAAGGRCWE